jgi:hypothetical protein
VRTAFVGHIDQPGPQGEMVHCPHEQIGPHQGSQGGRNDKSEGRQVIHRSDRIKRNTPAAPSVKDDSRSGGVSAEVDFEQKAAKGPKELACWNKRKRGNEEQTFREGQGLVVHNWQPGTAEGSGSVRSGAGSFPPDAAVFGPGVFSHKATEAPRTEDGTLAWLPAGPRAVGCQPKGWLTLRGSDLAFF